MVDQNGFPLGITLRELIAALAIACVTAAGFWITVVGNESIANQQGCASNEKLIGIAILQYVQDYDGYLPSRGRGPSGGYPSWKSAITPYLPAGASDVFRCPANPRNTESDFDERYPVSYSANRGNGDDEPFVDPTDKLGRVSVSHLKNPAQTIGVVESTARCTDINVTNPGMYAQPTAADTKGNLFAGHSGRSNFLFLDGHVRTMRPLDTLDRQDGGTGSVNMWTNDLSDFSSTQSGGKVAPGDGTGRTVLTYSSHTYEGRDASSSSSSPIGM
jgi:prepilin-type processing-associated H-X9-DG protein